MLVSVYHMELSAIVKIFLIISSSKNDSMVSWVKRKKEMVG